MADGISIELQALSETPLGQVTGDLVVFVGEDLAVAPAIAAALPGLADLVRRAASVERFKGRAGKTMTVTAPQGLGHVERLVVIGTAEKPAPARPAGSAGSAGPAGSSERTSPDWRTAGGVMAGRVLGRTATIAAEIPGVADSATAIAEMALGARLRAYTFDRYKTKKKEPDEDTATRLVFAVSDLAAVEAAEARGAGLADGVNLARDLVNEPPNVLFPIEFARRAEALRALGVEVEILDKAALETIGMRALLAVGQGSGHDSCVVIMRWNGGAPDAAPVAFVGKGVCFDSGGISIKPAGGMEDMKGDMAGAACVVGLMHALAARGARANVVGAIGLTENMPDGEAQRPGDIIRTLSGQTVEMVNSDAEGRLVLGDVLWYVQERYKPAFMIDLATLTGAILVALAAEHAGLFANDDDLADRLLAAGRATDERVWRMPLGAAYDKMIESKFADMKNTGGRHGGAITAAQFLQRFVNNVPWAHLDIAGTGMNAPQTETNKSWGSGWGVRLLDRLVRDHYETGAVDDKSTGT